jgi:anaerobic selenocysteine-containing dehydrogenase
MTGYRESDLSQRTEVVAYCAQCKSRCGCIAEVDGGRLVGLKPLLNHPSGQQLCPKGHASAEQVYHPDRLLYPMRRTRPKGDSDPGFERISWNEALDTVADQMQSVAREFGAEGTAFSVTTASGTQISDGLAWVERLLRAYGSPNTIYGTEICNWHKDFATRFTFGHDIGVPDFASADVMMLWGNNPEATWLARSVEINKARKRGAKLLVVDPRPTGLARKADVWLQVRPGTDQLLALGLAAELLRIEGADLEFAGKWTNGPLLVRGDTGRFLRESDVSADGDEEVLLACDAAGGFLRYSGTQSRWLDEGVPLLDSVVDADLNNSSVQCQSAFAKYRAVVLAHSPAQVAEVTGITPAQLRAAAELLAQARRVAYYAWNGVGQSTSATQTDRALSLLYTLTGSYGCAGGNVPGSAAPFQDISGWDLIRPEQAAKTLGLNERPVGPPARGWVTAASVYNAILDDAPYPIRMLMSFGTNLLTSQPDPELADAALRRLDFHVHADIFLNAAAQYADIVLPVCTSWEREGLRAGFDASLEGQRRVQLRQRVVEPRGEARSDIDIVLGLAGRLGMADKFFGLNADAGREAFLAETNVDLKSLRATPEGIDVEGEMVRDAHTLPDSRGYPRGFPTPTRRVEIYSETLLEHHQAPLPTLDVASLPVPENDYPLMLGCAKSLVYCHGQHRNLPSLRRLMPDPPLEMAAQDASHRGIADGDWVRIVTRSGEALARARIRKRQLSGTVFGQHGWWVGGTPQAPYGTEPTLAANINQVFDTHRRDPVSGSIGLRSTACEVVRLALQDSGQDHGQDRDQGRGDEHQEGQEDGQHQESVLRVASNSTD